MKLHHAITLLLATGTLAGCDTTGSITASRTESMTPAGMTETTTVSGTITFTKKGNRSSIASASVTSLDVSDIAIDITGHRTAVLDGLGAGTLVVKDGATVIGSIPFEYAVYDSMAVAADPTTLNAWLANYPTADGMDVSLLDVPTVDTEAGVATLEVQALYGTDVVSTGGTSWPSGAGGGCGNPGGGGNDPFPEMPIELPGDGGVC